MDMGGSEAGGEDATTETGSLPMPKMIAIIAATFACLLVALWITILFAPIRFR